jgi:hypothetical protein
MPNPNIKPRWKKGESGKNLLFNYFFKKLIFISGGILFVLESKKIKLNSKFQNQRQLKFSPGNKLF